MKLRLANRDVRIKHAKEILRNPKNSIRLKFNQLRLGKIFLGWKRKAPRNDIPKLDLCVTKKGGTIRLRMLEKY